MSGHVLPQKLPLPMENMDPHLIVVPWAHPSPQPKRQLDRFSRFCTDELRVTLYFTMGRSFPLKIPPFRGGDLDPHLMHGSLPEPTRVL